MKLFTLIPLLLCQLSFAAPNISLEPGVEPPELLSQLNLVPGQNGLRSYEIVQPLWVDFAQKERSVYIPELQKVKFSPTEAYVFPVGAVLVKDFKMEVSKGVFQNIETRVLVRKKDSADSPNWIGYTYRWDGADAHLVPDQESPDVQLSVDATAPGGAREQVFTIPSRKQCLSCHNATVGYVRSFRTHQLNRLVNGVNQLAQLNGEKLFDQDIGEVAQYEKFSALTDQSTTLAERSRSYLSVNCSHCHNPDPGALCSYTGYDFRYNSFSLPAVIAKGGIVPGVSADSEIFKRMSSEIVGYRMPFFGTYLRDEGALSVLKDWIDGLK